MKENNSINEGGYSINKSFNYLVNLIEKGERDDNNLEQNNKENNSFMNEYFCCKECYNKFLNVIKKFKDNKVDLTKIDWGKYSSDNSNIIVKLVTYYYNLGLQNSNK